MMQPVVVRLPEEEKRLLELEAKRQRKSFAEITRRAIKLYLKGKPRKKSGVEVLLEWEKKSKKYAAFHKDENLSATYKDYLYGAQSQKK